jgi:hypothetical protein
MSPTELKFIIHSKLSQPELDHILRTTLPAVHRERHGRAADYFFGTKRESYCRIRIDSEHQERSEVVVSSSDGVTQLGFFVEDSRVSVPGFRLLLGQEDTILRRTWTTFKFSDEVVVSTVTFEGFDHVILSVSGRSTQDAADMWGIISQELTDLGHPAPRPERRSTFEMFVAPLPGDLK